jgi:hypothetical protein
MFLMSVPNPVPRTLHPDGLVFTHHDRVRVPLP